MLAVDSRRAAAIWLAAALSASCGGSTQEKLVAITGDNGVRIAALVWSANSVDDWRDVAGNSGILLTQHLPLAAMAPPGVRMELPCKESGTIGISGRVADPADPGGTPGDTVTAVYGACRDRPDAPNAPAPELSGEVALTIVEAAAAKQTMTVEVRDYKTTRGADWAAVNGAMTLSIEKQGAATIVTVSSARVAAKGTRGDEIFEDREVTLYDAGDADDAAFRIDFRSKDTSDRLGGAVRYETTATFTGTSHHRPSAGQLLIHGDEKSTVRLVALSDANVRVEIDADGDGAPDPGKTLSMSWADLMDAI